jgi:hypothetical protein
MKQHPYLTGYNMENGRVKEAPDAYLVELLVVVLPLTFLFQQSKAKKPKFSADTTPVSHSKFQGVVSLTRPCSSLQDQNSS